MSLTLTFADGTVISGLGRNGNNFISESEIDTSILTDEALSEIAVSGTETFDGEEIEVSETLNNAVLVQQVYYDGTRGGLTPGWYFVFREKSASEIEKEETEATITALQEENESLNDNITDLELALVDTYEAVLALSEE